MDHLAAIGAAHEEVRLGLAKDAAGAAPRPVHRAAEHAHVSGEWLLDRGYLRVSKLSE